MLDLSKTSYKDLVFARGDFLRLVRGPTKTYYNILYVEIHIWDQNNFTIVTSQQKKLFKGSISAKLVIMILL